MLLMWLIVLILKISCPTASLANNSDSPNVSTSIDASSAKDSLATMVQIVSPTELTKEKMYQLSPVLVLLLVLAVTAYFVYRFIMRLINEMKRWLQLLLWLTMVTFMVAVYYEPVRTGMVLRSIVDVVVKVGSMLGHFILWIAQLTS